MEVVSGRDVVIIDVLGSIWVVEVIVLSGPVLPQLVETINRATK